MAATDGDLPTDPAANDDLRGSNSGGPVEQDTSTLVPTSEEPSKQPNRWHKPRVNCLIAVLVVIALAAAANWPFQYGAFARSGNDRLFMDLSSVSEQLPVMAGWPFRYYIHYKAVDSVPEVSVFSWSALLRNLALVLVVAGVIGTYAYRKGGSTTNTRRFRISIGDLLVLVIFVAVPLGYWQWLGQNSQRTHQLAKQIASSEASVKMSAWLPKVIEPWMPQKLKFRFQAIRGVRMENPNAETVRIAAAIPTLQTFRVGGGNYDLADLQPLYQHIHLTELRIAGRDVDESTMQMVVSRTRLRSLDLSRTNVTAAGVSAISSPGLRYLNLMHSDVRLAKLKRAAWCDSIEFLYLPHPDTGGDDRLTIDGWQKLRELSIIERDTQLNSTPMKVELSNLPQLETLSLDQFQKFDLSIENTPKLKAIKGSQIQWHARIPRGGVVPGSIWLDRFSGSGLPSLEDFQFFCVDLKSFSIQGPTKIKSMGAGVFYRSNTQSRQANPYERALSPAAATALIEGIGNSTGPAEVDLDAVPLAGVDLAPLANNQQLVRLMIGASGTTLEQWRALSPMKWLTHLRLTNNKVDSEALQWALQSFPNLETLEYGMDQSIATTSMNPLEDWDELPGVHFENHENLRTIKRHDLGLSFSESVVIKNMPKLELSVDVTWPSRILIENAPRLTGISIDGPFPEDASITPLSNLSYFAAGGSGVTDTVVKPIAASKSLDRLTLAYPHVSAEVLAKLQLGSIRVLSLPGSAVDDNVVGQWGKLPMLSHLDLSKTKISAASLKKLLESMNLNTVILDDCQLQQADLGDLATKTDLINLSLAGIGITPEILTTVLQSNPLTVLNLSGVEVSDAVLDVLIKHGSGVRHLTIRDAQYNENKIEELLQTQRRMMVDLDPTLIDTRLSGQLLSSRRLMSQQDFQEKARFEDMMQEAQSRGRSPARVISPADLRPATLIEVAHYAKDGQYSDQFNQFNGNTTTVTPSSPASLGNWFRSALGNMFGGNSTAESSSQEDPDPPEDDLDVTSTDDEEAQQQ